MSESYSSEWIVVDAFPDEIQARLAQIALDKEGIESRLMDEHLVSIQPLFAQAVGGVKLAVSPADETQAQIILQQYRESETQAANNAETTCPYCGSHRIVRQSVSRWGWLFIVATLGVGGLVFYKKFRCQDCGHQW